MLYYCSQRGIQYDLTNQSAFYIEEIRSVYFGRCYMVCPLVPVEKGSFVLYAIRKEHDVTGNTFC